MEIIKNEGRQRLFVLKIVFLFKTKYGFYITAKKRVLSAKSVRENCILHLQPYDLHAVAVLVLYVLFPQEILYWATQFHKTNHCKCNNYATKQLMNH